jgi:hypothetical protein
MIDLLICLLVAIVIAAAVLAVVRAILALPPLSGVAPYGGVFYAIVVLILILLVVRFCIGGRWAHVG